jgi:hypothetical protein
VYTGFEVEIESSEPAERFARVLATLVNGSPVHLARVVVAGTVVYPNLAAPIDDAVTLRRCRFVVRHGGATIDAAEMGRIVGRLTGRYAWTELRPLAASPEVVSTAA